MRRIVSEVKNFFNPVWFITLLVKIVFWSGGFPLFRILPKKGFIEFFSPKIGPFSTSSIYSESAHKTLPEYVHFQYFRGLVKNPWKSWCKSWVERHSVYTEKKCDNFSKYFFAVFFLPIW
jgi:hypothetical protein